MPLNFSPLARVIVEENDAVNYLAETGVRQETSVASLEKNVPGFVSVGSGAILLRKPRRIM
jgi:hypothetical protein